MQDLIVTYQKSLLQRLYSIFFLYKEGKECAEQNENIFYE